LDQSLENMEIMRIQTQAEREAREEIDLLKAECERSASAAGRAQADAEKLLTRLELEEQDCRKALHELAVDLMPSSEDDNLEHRPQACKGEQVDAEDNCDAEIFAGVQHGGVLFGRTV
jgi:molecular chaperone GrpE (heat shock protein)